jgi:hypothetical protein
MLVSESLRKFNEVHWQQPGFLGSLSVEIDHGEAVIVNFWSDRQSAEAALPRMVPVVERVLEPIFASESQLLGSGGVMFMNCKIVSEDSGTASVLP